MAFKGHFILINMKSKTRWAAVFIVILIIGISIWILLTYTKPKQSGSPGNVWVAINPVQCLQNPWELDWLRIYGDASEYPKENELDIVELYFYKQGIQIYDIQQESYAQSAVCQACNCPRGDTIFLLVSINDYAALKEQGFEARPPREWEYRTRLS
jgi:hypothetical protein